MSRKISLFSSKMILFQIGIALTSEYIFLVDNNLFMSLAVLLYPMILLIFFNSVNVFNIEKSILSKLNLKKKIIRLQVFLCNFSLYILLLLMFIFRCIQNDILLNCLITIFIYQVLDIALLYKKLPIKYILISFIVMSGVIAFFYCQSLINVI